MDRFNSHNPQTSGTRRKSTNSANWAAIRRPVQGTDSSQTNTNHYVRVMSPKDHGAYHAALTKDEDAGS